MTQYGPYSIIISIFFFYSGKKLKDFLYLLLTICSDTCNFLLIEIKICNWVRMNFVKVLHGSDFMYYFSFGGGAQSNLTLP